MRRHPDGLFWEDDAGALHVDIVRILDYSGVPDTEANRKVLMAAAIDAVRERWPDAPLTLEIDLDKLLLRQAHRS